MASGWWLVSSLEFRVFSLEFPVESLEWGRIMGLQIFKNELFKIHPQAWAAWESDLPKSSCGCGWYYPMIPGCQQPSVFFLVSESSFQPQPLSEHHALTSNRSGYPMRPLFLLLWARSLVHLSSQTCAHLDPSSSQPLLLLGQGRLGSTGLYFALD